MSTPGKIRIIGGMWRGRQIAVKSSPLLRPTPNRVRETLFNWLQTSIEARHCLDLFAGTGALGFEAASRGAASVTLIECDLALARQIEHERQRLFAQQVKIVHADALTWLQNVHTQFDLVFVDPPFYQGWIERICAALDHYSVLNCGALVYVEAERQLSMPSNWTIYKNYQTSHVQCALLHKEQRTHKGIINKKCLL